jgi:selenocysteine-specific elongation factor
VNDTIVEVPVALGTAGHVDHGKTELVRALTGVDTDRLSEEKRRGITIELGFAPLVLSDGRIVSIVDVPGHERFIRQMTAGAAGIDAVIFVVAADEGVMQQTREHLEILELLGIRDGIIVLTKADLVDEDTLSLARAEVEELVKGTFLEGKSIVAVSAVKGLHLDELVREIETLVNRIPPRSASGSLFMPIDRAFPISGFGTVVTGTIYEGTVSLGDAVELMPKEIRAKVRSLQVHGRPVRRAQAGQRAAINLAGISIDKVNRGDVLCGVGLLRSTECVDVSLKLLASAPISLRHWQRVRLHVGTSDLLARVSLLSKVEIHPGDETFAQLLLEDDVAVKIGQRFVIRSYSPLRTIGGGVILFPYGKRPKGKVGRLKTLQFLEQLKADTSIEGRVLAIVESLKSVRLEELAILAQEDGEKITSVGEKLQRKGKLYFFGEGGGLFLSISAFDQLEDELKQIMEDFHGENPHLRGISLEETAARLSFKLGANLLRAIVKEMQGRGGITIESDDKLRLAKFSPSVDENLQKICDQIISFCLGRGFQLPTVGELAEGVGAKEEKLTEALEMLKEGGALQFVGGEFVLVRQIEEEFVRLLRGLEEITISSVRDSTNASRKYLLPLLEYMDAKGITRRAGNKRILLKKQKLN